MQEIDYSAQNKTVSSIEYIVYSEDKKKKKTKYKVQNKFVSSIWQTGKLANRLTGKLGN